MIKHDLYLESLKVGALDVIPEANDENEAPTLWAMFEGITYDKEGRAVGHWINIEKWAEHDFCVTNCDGYELTPNHYKTLAGATRKAREICERANASGCFHS